MQLSSQKKKPFLLFCHRQLDCRPQLTKSKQVFQVVHEHSFKSLKKFQTPEGGKKDNRDNNLLYINTIYVPPY